MTDPYLPAASSTASPRSRAVAVALGATLGVFGGHRYYAGKVGTGLMMTVTFGGMGLWWLYDFILLVAGQFKDGDGRFISQWAPNEVPPPGMVSAEQLEHLREEIDQLKHELMDVHERIDFQERLIQRGRQ